MMVARLTCVPCAVAFANCGPGAKMTRYLAVVQIAEFIERDSRRY